jgi:UDP-glucose 4-epimerase
VVDKRARFYQVDIRDSKLQSILQAERPDIVSHHAVQREQNLPCEGSLIDADVHIRGLLNVLESCVHAQVKKLIFASGGNSLYRRVPLQGAETPGPIGEDVEPYPLYPQEITKLAGEWYVRYYARQYRLPYLILRYADIYGEADAALARHPLTMLLSQLVRQCRPTIRGTDRDVRDHIFIDDVVRANLCALERGRDETLHISSAQGYSLKQFYHTAARLLQSELAPLYISPSQEEPTAIILDNRRAGQILRWQPEIDFLKGVNLAVERLYGKLVDSRPAEVPVHTEPLNVAMLPPTAPAFQPAALA